LVELWCAIDRLPYRRLVVVAGWCSLHRLAVCVLMARRVRLRVKPKTNHHPDNHTRR